MNNKERSSSEVSEVNEEDKVDGVSKMNMVPEPVTADITSLKLNPNSDIKQIELKPRGICDPIIALGQYTDETLEMLDEVQKNRDQKHSKAPPLRFYDVSQEGKPLYLDPRVESIRNKIWEYWYEQGLGTAKMVELLHIRNHVIIRHLAVCKARYDEWIDQYGLTVYGNPGQRLDDLLKEFKEMLEEIEADMKDEEASRKDIKELRKLKLELLDRIAKYQAIEPPKSIDVTIRTPAQETRDKMVELFPDADGVFK